MVLIKLTIFVVHFIAIYSFILNTKSRTAIIKIQSRRNVKQYSYPNNLEKEENGKNNVELGDASERIGGVENKNTVWVDFQRISENNEIIANLGQGFPNWTPPLFCREALVEAVMESTTIHTNPHQYTRTAGHPKLVKELSKRYSVHLQRNINSYDNIAVTIGASQALYLSLQSIIKKGDEVILFEPFFDLYVNQIKLAGGIPVYVPLTFTKNLNGGGEWKLERDALESKVSRKTKAIILNSPHNPTGKVFTREEMMVIAELIKSPKTHDHCVVLSDEVYKYIVHSPPKEEIESTVKENEDAIATPVSTCPGHVSFASLPGMWDHTVTISSAGKTFSATGWQVGWCIGPSKLIQPIHQLLPYVQFCASTLMQEALARSLPRADLPYEGYDSYYEYLRGEYTRKRDMLVQTLKSAGFDVPNYNETPGGGFFIFARVTEKLIQKLPSSVLNISDNKNDDRSTRLDWKLCKWLAEEKGLLCIPSSPFFSEDQVKKGVSDEFIRIAFCKMDETIEAASQILQSLDDHVIENETSKDCVSEVTTHG